MKRTLRVLIVLALCLLTILPTTAFATTFTCYDVGISMDFDEDYWYVFTRDNLEGNPELDELGISYDFMYSYFQDNNAHLDAITLYDDDTYLEIVLQQGGYISQVEDLSSYSDSDVLDFASGVAQELGVSDYDAATIGEYKYAVVEYISASTYFHEYYTIVDYITYVFTFSSPVSFTANQYDEIYDVMSSVSFEDDLIIGIPPAISDDDIDVPAVSVPTIGASVDDSTSDSSSTASSSSDTSKASKSDDEDENEDEDEDKDEGKDDDTLMKSILLGVLIGAVVGGVSGLVALLLRKKKTKKANAAADYPPAGSAYAPYGDPQPPVPNPYGYPQPPAQNPYGSQPPAQNPYGSQPPAQNPYGQPQPPAQNPYGYPQAPSGYHNQPQGQHNQPQGQHNYR